MSDMEQENENEIIPEPQVNAEESDGEDLMANMEQDYNAYDSAEDRYEQVGLASEGEVDEISHQQRVQAEREMYERDRLMGRQVQAPMGVDTPQSQMDFGLAPELSQAEFEDPDGEQVNFDDYDGPLVEVLQYPQFQNAVKRKFRDILTTYRDEQGNVVYPTRIQQMAVENKRSLLVNYLHLSLSEPKLAISIADCPRGMLDLLDEEATACANELFPEYWKIHQSISVRLTDMPIYDKLRDLRYQHLNVLIKTSGVVTRRSDVFPQLEQVKYDCGNCGYMMGPYVQRGNESVRPETCPQCGRKGPFRLNVGETLYRNYQTLMLQEAPGSVEAGRVPRSQTVVLTDDLVDTVRPGEEIHVTGIYVHQFDSRMNIQQGFPVFTTLIEAVHIDSAVDKTVEELSEEDEAKIMKLSEEPNIGELIINSICPSICGYKYIKRALSFAMFGGQEKKSKNKHRVRGDINILILGDPGCGKSQFLKWVEKVSPRAVYATGKGASAVGLTAGVRKDPLTQEWTLEGGALVLADRGICLIDEFDKMNEQDRTSIHEAMEQQTISVSKAGIVADLQARCSVIAAANPVRGRYDGSLNFVENVDLTDPILSRFDVLAVVRDRVDPIRDETIANWVVDNHIRAHPYKCLEENEEENEEEEAKRKKEEDTRPEHLDKELLKKYIMYAKSKCHPKLQGIDKNKIKMFYSDLRQKSMDGGGIPIAVRHIESILRMAEANARIHLKAQVRDEDVDLAIRTLLESFIATQKMSVRTSLENHFRQYLDYKRDNIEILMHILQNEVRDTMSFVGEHLQNVQIKLSDLQKKAKRYKISDVSAVLQSERFKNEGYSFDSSTGNIEKYFAHVEQEL